MTLEEYRQKFHKLPGNESKAEAAEAAKALKASQDEINAENEAYEKGEGNFAEKLNEFSDLTINEFEKEKEGVILPDNITHINGSFVGDKYNGVLLPSEDIMNDPVNRAQLDEVYSELDRQEISDNYDSRDRGLVTPARNQELCGSCVAFSTVGLVETCMVLAGAKLPDTKLSVQHLIDCGYDGDSMRGCRGATVHAYAKFVTEAGGQLPHEINYPYKDDRLTCPKDPQFWNSGAKVVESFYDYECNEAKMMKMVKTYGAVVASLYANDRAFMNYAEGVFDKCSQTENTHTVLVIGYGTNKKGLKYWIIRNSWGENWGEKGFGKIKRGENMCGIESTCVTAKCEANGTPDTTPTPPNPLKCNVSGLFSTSNIIKEYTFKYTFDGLTLVSLVRCKDDVCTPKFPWVFNACIYICGKRQCKISSTLTAPKLEDLPESLKCDVSGLFSTSNINGKHNFKYPFNGKTLVSFVRCKDNVCTPRVPEVRHACSYICGKEQCKRSSV